MHGTSDHPFDALDAGAIALDEKAQPGRSALMDDALTAGAMLASALEHTVDAALDEPTRERATRGVATAAATGAYAGMALWTLNALTVKDERTGRIAQAIAGLGLGVLSARS